MKVVVGVGESCAVSFSSWVFMMIVQYPADEGHFTFITFLSPLRGSPSSIVASRMTPQSYFLL
jgi:hypothetical protein